MAIDTATALAVDRTRLAHERTMMAWVRTGTSLISFGFTIYKFFDLQIQREVKAGATVIGPRAFALIMIGIGLTSLVIAWFQHREAMKTLGAMDGHTRKSAAGIVGILVAIMGIVAFAAVIFQI